MKYIHLFVITLFLLSSCSEDPVSSGSNSTSLGKPTLEIRPDSLIGTTYFSFGLSARVNNFFHDDILYRWDFGDGDSAFTSTGSVGHQYQQAGSFTITVTATDRFADTLIDTKTIPAIITDIVPYVTFYRLPKDTVLEQRVNGVFLPMIIFASSNLYHNQAVYHWTISNGPQDTVPSTADFIWHNFRTPGTYSIKVEVYDFFTGKFWASDSTTITVRSIPVTQDMLNSTKQVAVQFYSESVLDDSLDSYPSIVGGVQKDWNLSTHYLINGQSILCNTLDTNTIGSAMYRTNYVSINANLSNDLKNMNNVNVNVWDSVFTADSLYTGNIASFTLKDLRLVSVSDDHIVYAASDRPISSIIYDLSIEKLWTGRFLVYEKYGQAEISPFNEFRFSLPDSKPNYGLVIFSRK